MVWMHVKNIVEKLATVSDMLQPFRYLPFKFSKTSFIVLIIIIMAISIIVTITLTYYYRQFQKLGCVG